MRLPRFFLVIVIGCALSACQSLPHRGSDKRDVGSPLPTLLTGDYDSYAQSLAGSARWRISMQPLPRRDWLLWTASVDSVRLPSLSLPMGMSHQPDGGLVLTPHVPVDPAAKVDGTFDPGQWRALDACALRETVSANSASLVANRTNCATVASVLGEAAALLPVSIMSTATTMTVVSFADQTVDPARSIRAERVRWFDAWAAILGAGPQATPGSNDWHMNRGMRIGSEGGRVTINWRDGQPSGYSLRLERIAVQGGQLPLLKLSIVDSKDQAVAYAWSAPESDRIGLNLGWIQVGLERAAGTVTLSR